MRVLYLCAALTLAAATARGQTAGEFLRLGLGARSLALGDAMLAPRQDPSAIYWNPALLSQFKAPALEVMHTEGFGGATGYDALAWAAPLHAGRRQAVALALLRFSVNDIPTTTNFHFLDVGPDGIAGTHDPGEGNHSWDPGEPVEGDPSAVVWRSDVEWAVLAGYACSVGGRGSVGLCAKYLRQRVADAQSSGVGLDAAAQAELGSGVTAAIRIADVTATRVTWSTGARESLHPRMELAVERTVAFGAGNSMRVLAGASTARAGLETHQREWHGGVEYGYRGLLFLRAGSSSGEPSFGAGVGAAGVRFDYATVPFHELGGTHRVSGLIRW